MNAKNSQVVHGGTASIFSICLVMSVSVFSTISLYAQNVTEITFLQFLPFLLAFLALGLLTYALCRRLLKQADKAALMTAWLMAVFCNFGFFSVLFPAFHTVNRVPYLLCGLFCIALSCLVFWVIRRGKSEITGVLCQTLSITFSALLLLNVGMCIVNSARIRKSAPGQTEELVHLAQTATKLDRPNVYFMIFDEYAGIDELQSYFGYDNTAFYHSLSDLGFTMARGCTNERTNTMFILADLLNLQFLNAGGATQNSLRHQIENGALLDVMTALDYTLYDTESNRLTRLINPIPELPSFSAPVTEKGGTYVQVFLYNTAAEILYNEIEDLLWGANVQTPDVLNLVTEYYATIRKPEQPSFFFSYVCSPHGPFYFDANGTLLDDPGFNWEDTSLYLGQLEYVNKRIEYAVGNIIDVDPDSIIILMSDHGSRYHSAGYDEILAEAESLDIFAGVYYRGQPLEGLDGMDGINLIRFLLNKTYGMELPLLEYWEDGHLTDTVGRRALGLS